MKVEVIECSTGKTIETYSMSELSLLDFQEWKESPQIIPLNKLSGRVAQLDPCDPETREPIISNPDVGFYLPDPLKNRAFSQFAELQIGSEKSEDQINEVTERVSTPGLELSTILFAIITEILQNHHPHSDYKVRISDE